MNSKEYIIYLLAQREWHSFECKRAKVMPAKLLEAVVAFANTDGGIIVVGLEDPDKATGPTRLLGISEGSDNISEFLKLVQREIDPPLPFIRTSELAVTNASGKSDKLLLIRVNKSSDVHSLRNGDTFVRKGRQNIRVGAREILKLQYEKGTIKYESDFTEIASLDGLDKLLLAKYKKDTNSQALSDWQFLKDNGLAVNKKKGLVLSKAGALLFGQNPAVLLGSKCNIKISHYFGTRPTYTGEPNFVRRPFSIEGPLIKQIELAITYFRDVARSSRPHLSGGMFEPTFLIPEWAFQEAIANAVIHRNYAVQDDIQVRIFDDHVEIESPGTYPGHITVENIRTERFARNPIIQRTLNRFKNAPNLDIGEGVDRMFRAMTKQNLYEPRYFPPSIRPNSVLLYLLNLKKIHYWDTISNYLDKHKTITNSQAKVVTGVTDTLKMSRLLKSWVDKGLLERFGKMRGAYYIKPGQELSGQLFSDRGDNKS